MAKVKTGSYVRKTERPRTELIRLDGGDVYKVRIAMLDYANTLHRRGDRILDADEADDRGRRIKALAREYQALAEGLHACRFVQMSVLKRGIDPEDILGRAKEEDAGDRQEEGKLGTEDNGCPV